MSKYIVDSSVGLKSVIPEKDSDKASRFKKAAMNCLHLIFILWKSLTSYRSFAAKEE